MKKMLTVLAAVALLCGCKTTTVQWIEGEADQNGKAVNTLIVNNTPDTEGWELWFCQFRAPMTMLEGSNGVIEHISGTLYRAVPSDNSKKMVIRYQTSALKRQSWAPEGFYITGAGEKPFNVDVEYTFLPAEDVQTITYTPVEVGITDIIPAPKNVTMLEGTADCNEPSETMAEGRPAGWYKITADGKVAIEAADEAGLAYAHNTLGQICTNAGSSTIPSMIVEDWPDLQHRGLMLDVSRDFTDKEGVIKLITLIAHYKGNVLHLHLGDDEGWRLEIDGLPELTSYGARRAAVVMNGDGTFSEPDGLMPSYCGGCDPEALSPANGFYSRADFVEILQYADKHHVKVIPEFDTPGHSRAAIRSMEKRFETTGDATYRLVEPEDTSKYVSVQDYTDNALNVALPSTYAFIEKVFDEIIALYAEAGVELEAIHIGGDEVPAGAWKDSPLCQKLMAEKGWTDLGALKGYYIGRVLEIAKAKGVKIAGWQEVAQHLDETTFAMLKDNLAYTNIWSVSAGRDQLLYQYANDGVNVVISNAPNCYFDFAYNTGRKERGHDWGGIVDERRVFSLLPYDIYKSVRWDDKAVMADISKASDGKTPLACGAETNIQGVQGQLWAETIRNFDHVTSYFFPRAAGLFERGWNASPQWSATTVSDDPLFVEEFDKFMSMIEKHEIPYYESQGIAYRPFKQK